MTWFILSVLLLLNLPTTRTVDICELNRIHTADGKEQSSYWIWRDYQTGVGCEPGYHVVDWRHVDAAPFPVGKRQAWWDKKTKRVIVVDHRVYVEWNSFVDREIQDRQQWPEAMRKKL